MALVSGQVWPPAVAPDLIKFTSGGEMLIPGRWFEAGAGQYKPLYRKIIQLGALPNTTIKFVAHGLTCASLVPASVDARLYSYAASLFLSVPFVFSTLPDNVAFFLDATNIVIYAGNDRSPLTGVAVIQYAKTADPSSAF